MLQTAKRIIHEDMTSPTADEEYGGIDLRAASIISGTTVA